MKTALTALLVIVLAAGCWWAAAGRQPALPPPTPAKGHATPGRHNLAPGNLPPPSQPNDRAGVPDSTGMAPDATLSIVTAPPAPRPALASPAAATPSGPFVAALSGKRPPSLRFPPARPEPVTSTITDPGSLPELTVPFSLTNPDSPAPIPAVLALDVAELNLTETERAGITQLAAEFLEEVGTSPQDAKDPAYQKLWSDAQTLSDARMKARFGGEAWLRQHSAAYRQALGNSPPGGR